MDIFVGNVAFVVTDATNFSHAYLFNRHRLLSVGFLLIVILCITLLQ